MQVCLFEIVLFILSLKMEFFHHCSLLTLTTFCCWNFHLTHIKYLVTFCIQERRQNGCSCTSQNLAKGALQSSYRIIVLWRGHFNQKNIHERENLVIKKLHILFFGRVCFMEIFCTFPVELLALPLFIIIRFFIILCVKLT